MFNWRNSTKNIQALNKLGLRPWFPLLFLSLGITLAIVTTLRFLPPKLPLFYSVAWGDGQLATHQEFLIVPASISIIALLNLVLSLQLHPSQSFFKKALFLSSIIVSLILTITFIKIVLNFI